MNNSKLLLEDYKTSKDELETQLRKNYFKAVMLAASDVFLQIGEDAEKNGILLEVKETEREIRLYENKNVVLIFTLFDTEYVFWNKYHDILENAFQEMPAVNMAYYILQREGNLWLTLTKGIK